MAEGSAELELFRRRWREELAAGGKRRRREAAEGPDGLGRDGSGCLALACSLLDGESPAPRSPPPARPCEEAAGDETDDLLGQLIRDLNEINEVPFFDVHLPYELALKIFQYLGKAELGKCAQEHGLLEEKYFLSCGCWCKGKTFSGMVLTRRMKLSNRPEFLSFDTGRYKQLRPHSTKWNRIAFGEWITFSSVSLFCFSQA